MNFDVHILAGTCKVIILGFWQLGSSRAVGPVKFSFHFQISITTYKFVST
jgi:hypothetical protein